MTQSLSYDPNTLSEHDRYKLLISLVIPRPIALVTTLGPTGVVNAAPFSFFNMFSESPPLAVLGLQAKPGGSLKDTSAHIRDRGEFVINLVDEALGEQMNQCAVDFPPEISEIDVAKLTTLASEKVKTPLIAERGLFGCLARLDEASRRLPYVVVELVTIAAHQPDFPVDFRENTDADNVARRHHFWTYDQEIVDDFTTRGLNLVKIDVEEAVLARELTSQPLVA